MGLVVVAMVGGADDDAGIGDFFAGEGGTCVDADDGLGEEGDFIGCARGERRFGARHVAAGDDQGGDGFVGGFEPRDVAGGVGDKGARKIADVEVDAASDQWSMATAAFGMGLGCRGNRRCGR